MPELTLDLFGGPHLRGPDGPVVLSPYQRFALLVAGSRTREGARRAHLAWLLWEEDVTPATLQRIRQLLHAIRRRCGADIFDEGPGGAIRLDGTRILTDLSIVEDHMRTGRLQEAALRVSRGLGSDLGRPPTREFEGWLLGMRVALERRLQEEAGRAWDEARAVGDWPRARDAAEAAHLLAADDEAVVRMVIEARGATGSLQGAESAFSTFRDRLPAGASPDRRTLALVERVRSLRDSLEDAEAESRPPLVGRGEPLARLRQHMRRVAGGHFEIVLLTGEAGAGKSRLLDELDQEARLQGLVPLRVGAVEPERHLPMNSLLDALAGVDVAAHAQRMGEPWRTIVAGFLPPDAAVDRLPRVPPIQESSVSRRLLDAFSLLLKSVAEAHPVLLCIDDLHWVDETTLAVLRFAKRRWSGGRLGVVGTLRPTDVPGRDAPADGLRQFLAEATATVALGDLDEASARSLVEATAGRPLSPEMTERILALGGRNPFYLIELTKDHVAGRLGTPLGPGEALPVPISLQELFDRRFNGLEIAPQRVAELLAVLAQPVPVPHVADLVGLAPEVCALALDRLVEMRLVRVDRGLGSLRHELFRAAVYRRVTPARLALLHDRIADYLLASARPAASGEVALHLARAGRSDEAVRHGRRAAEEAVAKGAAAEACHFLELVIDHESEDTRRAEATADLARLLHANREMARAGPLLDVAATRLRRVGRPGSALRMSIRKVECDAESAGLSLERCVVHLAGLKAEAETREEWEALAVALDTELHLYHQAGDVARIRRLFQEIRECARRDDPAAACLAHASLAMNILFGDPDEALASARKAVQLAEEHGLDEHLLMAQTRLIVVLYFRGRLNLEEGKRILQAARGSSSLAGNRGLRVMLETNVAAFLTDVGALEEAEGVLQAIERDFETVEARIPKFNYWVNRAETALRRRDPDLAWSRLEIATSLVDESIPGYMVNILTAHRGLCALELGDLPIARQMAEALRPPDPRPFYDPTPILELTLRDCGRRGDYDGALAAVRAAAESVRGRLELPWIKLKVLEALAAKAAGVEPDRSVHAATALAGELKLGGLRDAIARAT